MIFKGFACLYLPCRSARPPSMTPCSPGSAPPRSKDLGDSYQIIFLFALPPLRIQPPHTVDLNHAHCSLWPFGLSSSYHRDGLAKIRQTKPQDRRWVLSTLRNLHSCITCTLLGSKEKRGYLIFTLFHAHKRHNEMSFTMLNPVLIIDV